MHYLACDLGAESGRLMLGSLEDNRLSLEELHRFPNVPIEDAVGRHWNVEALFAELQTGLALAGQLGLPIASISVDAWGLDYFLLDETGAVMEPTFCYRDSRNQRGIDRTLDTLPWETLYEETGIQFMQINSLFQMAAESPERIERMRTFLPLGDGFNYLLSGVAKAEISLASTTQLYNPRTRNWSDKLLDAFDWPRAKFPELIPSGTRLGALKPELAVASGLGEIDVLATCSHDTGAAVAAVPADGDQWAYLSSGTWSLIGVELPEPIINDAARDLNFTNEIGHGNTVRLLRNIIGLWLVQECRREWAEAGEDYDYATLAQLAEEARIDFRVLVLTRDLASAARSRMQPNATSAAIFALFGSFGEGVPDVSSATVAAAILLATASAAASASAFISSSSAQSSWFGTKSQPAIFDALLCLCLDRTTGAGDVRRCAVPCASRSSMYASAMHRTSGSESAPMSPVSFAKRRTAAMESASGS